MELILLAGVICVAWTSSELVLATARRAHVVGPHARFGAVNAEGRPLDVVLDRRTGGRREADGSAISVRV